MKKIHIYTLLIGMLALGLTACETEKEPVLSVKADAQLEAMPTTDYVFTTSNAADPFVIKWKAVDYGFTAVNTYTVVLKNKANGNTVTLGTTSASELSLTNADINAKAGTLFALPGQAADMSVSLLYSAYDGKLSEAAAEEIDFKVTPYDPRAVTWNTVYAAAGYPNWDFSTAYQLGDSDGDGAYEGYVPLTGGAEYTILDGTTLAVLAECGALAAEDGFYKVNYTGGAATVSAPMIWGVVGSATPEGWNADTQFEYDPDTRMWTKVVRLKIGQEFKFRANDDWAFNLGAVDGQESAMGGDLKQDGNNMIAEYAKDTTFLVTLNLTEAGKYTYTTEVTEFEQSSAFITVPGGYQGWNPTDESAAKFTSAGRNFIYAGTVYLPAGTEFKFYDNGVWTGIDGTIAWNADNSGGSFTIAPNGGANILMTRAGYYKFTVDYKKNTATFVETGWGLIGSGSPSGTWDVDTMMSYDPDAKTWSVTATLIGGEMKFRWDKAWDVNLGGSLSALVDGGDNIVVPAGTFKIVLDDVAKTATMTPQ